MSLPFSLALSFSFCRISIYLVHSLSISRSFYLSLSLCRISIYLSISRSFSFFLSIESLSISLYLVHSPSISIFLHYLFLSISNTNCNSVPNLFSIPSLSGYLLRTFKVSKVYSICGCVCTYFTFSLYNVCHIPLNLSLANYVSTV